MGIPLQRIHLSQQKPSEIQRVLPASVFLYTSESATLTSLPFYLFYTVATLYGDISLNSTSAETGYFSLLLLNGCSSFALFCAKHFLRYPCHQHNCMSLLCCTITVTFISFITQSLNIVITYLRLITFNCMNSHPPHTIRYLYCFNFSVFIFSIYIYLKKNQNNLNLVLKNVFIDLVKSADKLDFSDSFDQDKLTEIFFFLRKKLYPGETFSSVLC